jgi:hypothetical protein
MEIVARWSAGNLAEPYEGAACASAKLDFVSFFFFLNVKLVLKSAI